MSKTIKRRVFLKKASIAAGIAISLPLVSCSSDSDKQLKVLVLGGTNFLGPAIVKSLLSNDFAVTLFNRGKTNPQLFPELPKIRGDRSQGTAGYEALQKDGTQWDVVIDVWPDNPNYVEEAISVLKDKTKHYMFVSSIAVYRNYKNPGMDENAPLREGEDYEEGNYNLNKVLCERVVENNFPENFTIVRPGAIIGDRDPGPFPTYILNRMANRKEVLAPDSNDPTQFIDVKDIGDFMTSCCVNKTTGHFNLVGPAHTMGYKDMLLAIKKALNSEVEILWMLPEFLVDEMKLEPFMDIPSWIPLATDPEPGFYQISNQKALQNGLSFADFSETVRISYDSLVNNRHIPEEGESPFGISGEREDEIISTWKGSVQR